MFTSVTGCPLPWHAQSGRGRSEAHWTGRNAPFHKFRVWRNPHRLAMPFGGRPPRGRVVEAVLATSSAPARSGERSPTRYSRGVIGIPKRGWSTTIERSVLERYAALRESRCSAVRSMLLKRHSTTKAAAGNRAPQSGLMPPADGNVTTGHSRRRCLCRSVAESRCTHRRPSHRPTTGLRRPYRAFPEPG